MTKLTTSVIQQPQDVVLAIVSDSALPAMIVLQQSQHHIRDWLFQFAIIGESHHIRVEQAGTWVLNEVLACVKLAEADCLHYQAFKGLQAHSYQNAQYRVNVDFGEKPRWAVPDANVLELRYDFPETFGQQPFTRIRWRQIENTLHWWTLHTYAAAGRTVYIHTASVFHCRD
jgi:Protein of unknown function DUF2617